MSSSIDDLERNIDAERGVLDRTLSQLGAALSPEQISSTVARELKTRGGAVTHAAMDAARANPAGAVLVGLGALALLAGPRRPQPEPPYDTRTGSNAAGTLSDDALTDEFDKRVAAADDYEPRAPRMRAAINKGLANLPEPARVRIVKAREAAIEAQEKIDRQAAIAARKARSLHHRQPLTTVAVAAAVGALAAALLPRTRIEDDAMGARRDALIQQAELTLRDEVSKAARTGEAALRDGIAAGYDRVRQH